MSERYFIVDDDPAVRRMLATILGDLGEVVGEAHNGELALRSLSERTADVVLIDLLMPGMDGIELARRLKESSEASLVMISQVQAKEMVADAYGSGIDFYIHKPINAIEVRAVLARVSEARRLKSTFDHIARSVSEVVAPVVGRVSKLDEWRGGIRRLLHDVGAGGEIGARDIEDAVLYLLQTEQTAAFSLRELLMHVAGVEVAAQRSSEQRIRRAIGNSLRHLAALGLEDYTNPRFEQYAAALFEFNEVRAEMRFLEGMSASGGKISIKRYLSGIAHSILRENQT